jgi:hypothetical protein
LSTAGLDLRIVLGRPMLDEVTGGWRRKLAWRLRFWADRLDGLASYGMRVNANVRVTPDEWQEAVAYGVFGMHAHLKALLMDRMTDYGSCGVDDGMDNRRNTHD